MPVNFFTEDLKFTLKTKKKTSNWVERVIHLEGFTLEVINFIFCSDEYLIKINRQYLNHNTLTDIITFDNSDNPYMICGDIFISINRITENSKNLKISFDEELHRVIIHGILHLTGHFDKTEDQKAQMRKREDAYLSLR